MRGFGRNAGPQRKSDQPGDGVPVHRTRRRRDRFLPTIAPATTAAAPAAAPIFTRNHRTRFSNSHVSSAVFRSVELLNCVCSFLIAGHFYKTETFAPACITIGNDLCRLDASGLGEYLLERLVGCAKRKVSYIKFLTHVPPSQPHKRT